MVVDRFQVHFVSMAMAMATRCVCARGLTRRLRTAVRAQKVQTWRNGRLVEEYEEDEEDAELLEMEQRLLEAKKRAVEEEKAKSMAKGGGDPIETSKEKKTNKSRAAANGPPPASTSKPLERKVEAVSASGRPPMGGLQINKADYTVNSMIDKIDRGKLNLRPAYQREYVWDRRTASRLVESLLLNVPVPTLFFHETSQGELQVVDGKQRLTSIWSYMKGEFPDGSEFPLQGLEVYEELNGLRFAQLSEQQQEIIKDYALNVHTISRNCEPDFVFEVFERLNMGAMQLNEQELRNCIYQGSYTDLLAELAEHPTLLEITGSDKPHVRMKDRELILRFFAMQRTGPEGFKLPAKAWLNEEIRQQMDITEVEAAVMRKLFDKAINLAFEVFGKNAFRNVKPKTNLSRLIGTGTFETGEVNVALWDTLLYSFALAEEEQVVEKKDKVLEEFVKMAGEPTFRKMLVSQPKAILARHEIWSKALKKAVK